MQSLELKRPATGFGFGGAEVVEIEKLAETGGPGDLTFFGVDIELGRQFGIGNPGAATFVRENTFCMLPWTQAFGAPCHDIGIVSSDDPVIAFRDLQEISRHICSLGRRPALIGCDHFASLPCAAGAAEGRAEAPTYLYFDAHYDLGLHRVNDEKPQNGNFVNSLIRSEKIAGVINVGGRCWSAYSPVYNEVPGFTAVNGGVPRTTAGEMIERLSSLKGKALYVSIDADVLDPAFSPNVCCPEPFGMTTRELFEICGWIGKSCEVIGGDICEIMPSARSLASEQAIMRCFFALFPRRVHRNK